MNSLYSEDECIPDSEPFPGSHCHTFDAFGQRVMFVLWCDTETGELERYYTDAHMQFERDENGLMRKIRETRAAPLRVAVLEPWPPK